MNTDVYNLFNGSKGAFFAIAQSGKKPHSTPLLRALELRKNILRLFFQGVLITFRLYKYKLLGFG